MILYGHNRTQVVIILFFSFILPTITITPHQKFSLKQGVHQLLNDHSAIFSRTNIESELASSPICDKKKGYYYLLIVVL